MKRTAILTPGSVARLLDHLSPEEINELFVYADPDSDPAVFMARTNEWLMSKFNLRPLEGHHSTRIQ
jgi:hypothetical protein